MKIRKIQMHSELIWIKKEKDAHYSLCYGIETYFCTNELLILARQGDYNSIKVNGMEVFGKEIKYENNDCKNNNN